MKIHFSSPTSLKASTFHTFESEMPVKRLHRNHFVKVSLQVPQKPYLS